MLNQQGVTGFYPIFEQENGIALDQVYTGKMMFGSLIALDKISLTARTPSRPSHGGLQGRYHAKADRDYRQQPKP